MTLSVTAVPLPLLRSRRPALAGRAGGVGVLLLALSVLGAAPGARASEPVPGQAPLPAGEPHAPAPHLSAELEGGLHPGGSGLAVGLLARWGRLGVGAKLDALSLHEGEGHTPWGGTVGLVSLMPTFDLLHWKAGHLRASAGLDAAFAGGHSWVGPGIGMHAAHHVAGPLEVEAAAGFTPFPFTRVDAQVGLAAHLGSVAVRGGYRRLQLNDHGRYDGLTHEDVLSGPFMGVGLDF
jgi:hypothetical protein